MTTRLLTQARILSAAAVLNDGRSSHARSLKRDAALLSDAAFYILGLEAQIALKRFRKARARV